MRAQQARRDDSPPALDEGYWASLLHEAEQDSGTTLFSDILHDTTAVIRTPSLFVASPTVQGDWQVIRTIKDRDEPLDLTVTSFNRGGLLVEWRTLRGFIPASQLTDFPPVTDEAVRKRLLASYVGRTLHLRVIELNEISNRLIFSERAAAAEPGERAHILSRLHPGDRVRGEVTNLCDFGAFVDLGGLEGLIHISELSWGRVGHPAEILARGQIVEAAVLEVQPDNGRVALSFKRLHPDPWQTVSERYQVGEMIEGTVTNVVDFGAFVRIEEGLEGLIHVSELAEGHFLHPRSVVAEGQRIRARILSVDGRGRRLALSLRTASANGRGPHHIDEQG
jgi:small subunit ribosomal protein S1